ncbi:MAG: MATE family efflux transporter [Lachnospiraceae bacterium]|nr:MATE family efflux transporter [Lachnospiraceae bacterium]
MTDTVSNENVKKALVRFAIPYMIAAFLQTLYGLVDLFVVGLFNTATTTTAVALGSQIMHMITVIILGLVLGITVQAGNFSGAGDKDSIKKVIGTSLVFFAGIAVIFTLIICCFNGFWIRLVLTPAEAVKETRQYLLICGLGVPFIFGVNIFSGIFRGLSDSRRPMYAVIVACFVNIILDFVFVGGFNLGAAGAALATVFGQLFSCIAVYYLFSKNCSTYKPSLKNCRIDRFILKKVVFVGIPVALQDGFIQIAFLVITIIANARGLIDSAAVGVVEKLICFFFLVPSAFMSAISALTAQNMGAGNRQRAKETLRYGLIISVSWGLFIALINQFIPQVFVSIFTRDELVRAAGAVYLKAYSFDTIAASVHFCFSGYFCGDQKSYISFLHNIISVLLIRIPGAYFASKFFTDTLYPMGLAAPVGSAVSALICIGFYIYYIKKEKKET